MYKYLVCMKYLLGCECEILFVFRILMCMQQCRLEIKTCLQVFISFQLFLHFFLLCVFPLHEVYKTWCVHTMPLIDDSVHDEVQLKESDC